MAREPRETQANIFCDTRYPPHDGASRKDAGRRPSAGFLLARENETKQNTTLSLDSERDLWNRCSLYSIYYKKEIYT